MAQLCPRTLVMVMPSLAARVSFRLEAFSGICRELRQFNNMWPDTSVMIARVTLKIISVLWVSWFEKSRSK